MVQAFLREYMKIWIFYCQILGLFPYHLSGGKIVKSRYYLIHLIRCFILYIGNELYFSQYKYHFSFFGWIYEIIDLLFVILWLVYWFQNNISLIEIFKLFDEFDEKFKTAFHTEIRHKHVFHTFGVIVLLVLYTLNFLTVATLVYLNGTKSIVVCLVYGFVRSLERSIFVLFTALHLYLVYCLKFRYEKLKQVWNDVIYVRIRHEIFDSHLTVQVMEMRLMFSRLSNIVETVNCCLGSRFIVLHGQLFNQILMYFYMMFSGIKLSVVVLPFYVIPPLFMSVASQNLGSSATVNSNLFELPFQRIPERLTQQMYAFAQQLRCCPIKIDAAGCFCLNLSFFLSMVFSMASYLVAIFQLAPLMNRISSKTAMSIL